MVSPVSGSIAADALDLVAPQLDADRLLLVGGEDLDGVAAHPEGALLEGGVVAAVLDRAPARRGCRRGRDSRPSVTVTMSRAVLHRIAQAVDRAHRGDDDHVVPLHQARRGPQPQPLDVLVDRRVLLDVRVGRGDVRLGLVVVVVGDEVLDRVGREELLAARRRAGRPASCCGTAPASAGRSWRSRAPASASCPIPVTPSSVWYLSPRTSPAVSSAMALGWSPAGCEWGDDLKGRTRHRSEDKRIRPLFGSPSGSHP